MAFNHFSKPQAFIYLSNEFLNISALIDFFELLFDTIHLICTKLLTNKQSNDEAKLLFDSLPLSEVNKDDSAQHDFILETLLQFDQY